MGSHIFYDDASGQSLLQAIEDNNIVVLVTDTADTSQLPSIVCSSGLSNHSKIAFVESSDYKAKEGACTLSRRMNLRKGLEV
ncbi:hypothetical protein Tco_0539605 [Tanacetum coccineum]